MKKIILILLFVFICNINIVMAEEKSPVLHYSFDMQDTQVSENGYIIEDLSGNGYDTECSSSAIVSEFDSMVSLFSPVNAVKNECFDASSYGLSLPVEAFKGVEDFTMSFWFASKISWKTIFSTNTGEDDITLTWMTGSGMMRLMSYCESESPIYSILPYISNQELYSKMHMYTIVKSGEQITMYFDGQLEEPQYQTNRKSSRTFADITASLETDFYMVNGYIDEFRFYNEALSADEIKQIFNSENPIITTELEVIGEYADKVDIAIEESPQKTVFNMTAINNSTVDISKIKLMIAEYDDKDCLINVKISDFQKIMGAVTVSTDLPLSENYKILIWDDNQSPLINAIANN